MQMPGRGFSSSKYRYGFNGQEKSDEIAGEGNHNTALFWEYDTRIGRRWNLDPEPTIGISEYAVLNNSPLLYNDILGNVANGRPPHGGSLNIITFFGVYEVVKNALITKDKLASSRLGQAAGKTVDQVAVASVGLMNGFNSQLSFGLYNRPPESIGLNEEHHRAYYLATEVGKAAPLPTATEGAGESPSLALSGGGQGPVAKVTKFNIKPSTTVLANQSTNEANSEATVNHQRADAPTNDGYTYAPRVRERSVQDPGAHNFPYSFDQEILKTKPIAEVDGSNSYILSGSMNGKNGFFILGVNERTKTIFHRSFESKYIPRKPK